MGSKGRTAAVMATSFGAGESSSSRAIKLSPSMRLDEKTTHGLSLCSSGDLAKINKVHFFLASRPGI